MRVVYRVENRVVGADCDWRLWAETPYKDKAELWYLNAKAEYHKTFEFRLCKVEIVEKVEVLDPK
jgi:hypothetical protein